MPEFTTVFKLQYDNDRFWNVCWTLSTVAIEHRKIKYEVILTEWPLSIYKFCWPWKACKTKFMSFVHSNLYILCVAQTSESLTQHLVLVFSSVCMMLTNWFYQQDTNNYLWFLSVDFNKNRSCSCWGFAVWLTKHNTLLSKELKFIMNLLKPTIYSSEILASR